MVIFPFVGCLPGTVGLDYIMSLPLLPTWLWFVFLLVVEIYSASHQLILIDSCSVNSYNFGVPVGGGAPRPSFSVPLGYSPGLIFFFLVLKEICRTIKICF